MRAVLVTLVPGLPQLATGKCTSESHPNAQCTAILLGSSELRDAHRTHRCFAQYTTLHALGRFIGHEMMQAHPHLYEWPRACVLDFFYV